MYKFGGNRGNLKFLGNRGNMHHWLRGDGLPCMKEEGDSNEFFL